MRRRRLKSNLRTQKKGVRTHSNALPDNPLKGLRKQGTRRKKQKPENNQVLCCPLYYGSLYHHLDSKTLEEKRICSQKNEKRKENITREI